MDKNNRTNLAEQLPLQTVSQETVAATLQSLVPSQGCYDGAVENLLLVMRAFFPGTQWKHRVRRNVAGPTVALEHRSLEHRPHAADLRKVVQFFVNDPEGNPLQQQFQALYSSSMVVSFRERHYTQEERAQLLTKRRSQCLHQALPVPTAPQKKPRF